MSTWEYTSVSLMTVGLRNDKILNEYGAKGWELVSVVNVPVMSGSSDLVAYLKREKR